MKLLILALVTLVACSGHKFEVGTDACVAGTRVRVLEYQGEFQVRVRRPDGEFERWVNVADLEQCK